MVCFHALLPTKVDILYIQVNKNILYEKVGGI